MENCQYYSINLLLACRICLGQTEKMENILADGEKQSELLQMFTSFNNFQIEKIQDYPHNICNLCEEKLNRSYTFREQCRKSNDFIKECLKKIEEVQLADEAKDDDSVDFKYEDVTSEMSDEKVNELEERNENVAAHLKCNFCNFAADDHRAIEAHMAEIHKDVNNWCSECNKTFDDINTHTKQHSDIPLNNKRNGGVRLEQFSLDVVSEQIISANSVPSEDIECICCGFITSNLRGLAIHMTHIHKDIRHVWCSSCNKIFENIDDHKKEHTYLCNLCGKSFASNSHLTDHLRGHADIRPFKCKICNKSYISMSSLKNHFRTHTQEKPYECRHCDKSFTQYNAMYYHLKQHGVMAVKYGCDACGSNFDSKDESEKHECKSGLSEVKRENFVAGSTTLQNFCELCDRKVRSLSVHMKRTHANGYDKKTSEVALKLCNVCGKQFKTNAKLTIHMRVHTGEAPYKCPICDKRMATRNHLVLHQRTHSGEKPHVCHVCGKSFAQSSVLNTHMRLHTGRPIECTMCEKRFCRPAELKMHMRRHTGEKPYACDECKMSFVQKSHLVEHSKTHSDERPYQCRYCPMGFKQNSTLKSHESIHLGQKPYKCTLCSYACRQSYGITLHMKTHLQKTEQFTCVLCNDKFTSQELLSSHEATAHGFLV